jgi:hypothetical protein
MFDCDSDGVDDLLTMGSGGKIRARLGDGVDGFGPVIESRGVNRGIDTGFGDFDQDGIVDAVIVKDGGDHDAIVFRGRGDGTFTPAEAVANGDPYESVVTGDFDGDGLDDFAARGVRSTTTRFFFGIGDFLFDGPYLAEVGDEPTPVDLDGDGRVELLMHEESNRPGLVVLFPDGARGFTPSGGMPFFGCGLAAPVGDVNGDGLVDLCSVQSEVLSVVLNFSDRLPENAVRRGNVNAAAGLVADVLFVNGRKGIGAARRLVVSRSEPFQMRMKSPPSIGETGPAEFALFAWLGTAEPSTLSQLPLGLGPLGLPMAAAKRAWNNTGDALFGDPDLPSLPAPSLVLRRQGGVRRKLVAYVQGVIEDPLSPSGHYGVTNGVEIVSR